jgi:hypothetical protein
MVISELAPQNKKKLEDSFDWIFNGENYGEAILYFTTLPQRDKAYLECHSKYGPIIQRAIELTEQEQI